MLGPDDLPALLLAFLITLLEMTEVVALVFALGAEGGTLRPAALGAVAGTATVGTIALVVGVSLRAIPTAPLLWVAAAVLFAFGIFLFRSTLRTYRRLQAGGGSAPPRAARALPFAGGFAVGGVETTEAVVVLLAITAGGHGLAALVGAVAGGAVLVVVAALVHDRVRRIKVPTLKLGATAALFTFATFWAGEAAGIAWPGPDALSDLYLVPIFLVALVVVRALVRALTPRPVVDGANR